MNIDYDEIRAKAEAAKESWVEAGNPGKWYELADFRKARRGEKPIAPPEPVDAEYIAAVSPDVVGALLDRIAELRAERECWLDNLNTRDFRIKETGRRIREESAKVRELRAENAKLRVALEDVEWVSDPTGEYNWLCCPSCYGTKPRHIEECVLAATLATTTDAGGDA